MLAFAISAFIAGIGGAVIAYQSATSTADQFDYTQSLVVFAFAYLGGISSVSGAIVGRLPRAGGLVFTFLQDRVRRPAGVHAGARRARADPRRDPEPRRHRGRLRTTGCGSGSASERLHRTTPTHRSPSPPNRGAA